MYINTVSNTDQIKVIEALAYTIWHEYYTPIIGGVQVDYMLKKFQSSEAIEKQINNGFLYFVCEDNNDSLGYMSVNIIGEQLFLSKFYISSENRRKGYGKEMIVFLEDLARKKGLKKMALMVNRYNTDSIKMYEKVGFDICGTIVQDIGNGFIMDDYKMEKSL